MGGGSAGGEAYELFVSLLRRAWADLPGEHRVPSLGDPRTRSAEGLAEILGPAGFGPPTWSTARIDFGGPVELVWEAMARVYDMGPLPAAAVAELREAFLAGAAELAPAGGPVPCAMTMKFATARLRG
ncbi:hypothetical protein [Streptomyces montanisoli]|uniref:hypothetical protein n=1 Tax=Streptomyces montanisoli TaxID=2798581 RepID=UPI001FD74B9C|nr:hypothetical protein [Streptomyces montanisoli]